jgi:uncharacterized glyoxalase superfamily protein PhnB
MPQQVVPMIHVPDVRAAMKWYASIGFRIELYNEEDGEINWAKVTFGGAELMFNKDGKPSDAFRREVDLYVLVDNIDETRLRLEAQADIIEDLHDTFYGMREFIIRDLNRFWITFGQPIAT